MLDHSTSAQALLPAFAATIAAAAYLAIGIVVFARRKPGYNQLRDTISELGEHGARDARIVAFGLFAPVGLALLVVAWLMLARAPTVSTLALCIAVGYLGAALFPCDPGSPVAGSARQGLHNLAGGVEYIGGGFALLTLARDYGLLFQAAGFVAIGSAIALTLMAQSPLRGLIQRIAEAFAFGGLALAVWRSAG